MRGFFSHLVTAILGGIVVIVGFMYFYKPSSSTNEISSGVGGFSGSSLGKSVNYTKAVDSLNNIFSVGFGDAASKALEPVVHIRSISLIDSRDGDFLGDGFWGSDYPGRLQEGAGSGVLISKNGYIVTNNHVVDNAKEISVTLFNKRSYSAKIVGVDPSTDLAVIKINEKELPITKIANSDQVRVGDWVLAVGNPFNLASTVTAGIVSAKARNIHILSDNSAIESFIQTDAAVNPGNSGGALVNLNGDLIGINTAIATPTGTYAGYSFAVPSNIVRKVVNDLIEHGEVQRGYLGVVIRDLDWQSIQRRGLKISQGVIVDKLVANGAGSRAGLRAGDVITMINQRPIRSTTELIEIVASHRPGDQINLTVQRDGEQLEMGVKLQR